jgi:THO complex subunit 5
MTVDLKEAVLLEAYKHVQDLRKLATEVLALSRDKATDETKLALKRRELMERTIELRLLNRQCQQLVKSIKEETARKRQDADNILLDIQNIQYEHKHLRSEIAKCEDIESKHLSLDLIPAEEFLEQHPDTKDLSAHEFTMARLRDEEERRLKLFVIKSRLNEQKTKLSSEVSELKDDIEDRDGLEKLFNSFAEGASELQKYFHKR